MTNVKEVINGLEMSYKYSNVDEENTLVPQEIVLHAIALLKAQEPRVMTLEEAPAVDAIPVEWLENRLNTLCFEAMGAGALYGDRIGELAKSINEVMKLWQKEQEART